MALLSKASRNSRRSMKGNLLLIDDETMLLDVLKVNLSRVADTILTADNGKDALLLVSEKEIHCIVCDINMPHMNGVEVLKRLREMKSEIPFIFYTAHGNQDLMMEAVKYGAFDFLDKPYFEGLEEVTARALAIGLSGSSPLESDFQSDYQRLLSELDDKKSR